MSAAAWLMIAVWPHVAPGDAATMPARRAAAGELRAAFDVDGVRNLELTVLVPHPGGRWEPYAIYVRGTPAVKAAVDALSQAKIVRGGECPADPAARATWRNRLPLKLVVERDPDLAELERRGELLLDLIAEEDAPPPRPATTPSGTGLRGPAGDAGNGANGTAPKRVLAGAGVLAFAVSPAGLELIAPDPEPALWLSLRSDEVRTAMVAAVAEDVRLATELWGDHQPYGAARSGLAAGLAFLALGERDRAVERLRASLALCRRHKRWPALETEAAERLADLERPIPTGRR